MINVKILAVRREVNWKDDSVTLQRFGRDEAVTIGVEVLEKVLGEEVKNELAGQTLTLNKHEAQALRIALVEEIKKRQEEEVAEMRAYWSEEE